MIPPVGQNFISGNTCPYVFRAFKPPKRCAGKNLKVSQPNCIPLIMSLGVDTPSIKGIPESSKWEAKSELRPGLTRKSTFNSIALAIWSLETIKEKLSLLSGIYF